MMITPNFLIIRNDFIVDIDLSKYGNNYNTGVIGTSDRPIQTYSDYTDLKSNKITVADMESAAIAYVCKRNDVEIVIIKGISDFPNTKGQGKAFIQNVKPIMKKIFDSYIQEFI